MIKLNAVLRTRTVSRRQGICAELRRVPWRAEIGIVGQIQTANGHGIDAEIIKDIDPLSGTGSISITNTGSIVAGGSFMRSIVISGTLHRHHGSISAPLSEVSDWRCLAVQPFSRKLGRLQGTAGRRSKSAMSYLQGPAISGTGATIVRPHSDHREPRWHIDERGQGSRARRFIPAGTFAPGTPAVRHINGGGRQSARSRLARSYLVQVNPSSTTSANVTGTASLSGQRTGHIRTRQLHGQPRYDILHSSGLGGTTFASLGTTNLPANFIASLSYSATDVFLNPDGIPRPAPIIAGRRVRQLERQPEQRCKRAE